MRCTANAGKRIENVKKGKENTKFSIENSNNREKLRIRKQWHNK